MAAKVYLRRLTPVLLKEIKLPGITVLTGMRQVGKTTLLRQIYDTLETKHKIFLDMENPLNQKIFEEENFDNITANLGAFGFSAGKQSFIFLDEIQVAPEIIKAIKYLYDHYKIKFFLTGSSSFYLKNLFPESLAGRKINYELFPLDFEEFLIFKTKKKKFYESFSLKAENKNKVSYLIYSKLLDEYLEFGGFPAVVLEANWERKREILKDIFTSYFEKDVRTLADFHGLGKLRDLILLLTSRAGSKLDISKISSELGISRETVYSHLSFLEKTYFIFLVSPFSRNTDGEVKGAKKIYFCDNGLLNYLGKLSEGAVFENSVFLNLKKYGKLNYYQKYKGPEIDFILNENTGFEVKITPTISDSNRLNRLADTLKLKESYLLTKSLSEQPNVVLAQDL